MELVGKIKAIFDTQNISAKFSKRELVLLTDERYPQQILVEFTQDKIVLLDDARAGDEVRIQFDLRGREWTSPRGDVKYFVSVQGWRIEAQVQEQEQAAATGAPAGASPEGPGFGDAPLAEGPDGYGGEVQAFDDIPF